MSILSNTSWRWPLGLIALISLWRLAIAASLPVTQDEAYYFDWARTLAWGYFDHPPGIALLGFGTVLAPGSVLMARLGGWLAGTLTLVILWRLFWRCGLRDQVQEVPGRLSMALLLTGASLPGFAVGVLATPDTVLALCWALALHEGLAALSGQRWRWLSTGAAVGLGLLGKYSMLLIGPVFLWAILAVDARALRTRWPYLGALIALLLFSPNLLWNAQNDWLSLRFQFGHGFSTDTGALHLAADAISATADQSAPLPEPVPSLGARLASVAAFVGTQLALFGVLLLPLLAAVLTAVRRRARRGHTEEPEPNPLSPPARALLLAAALFPLLLFAALASFSEVEPNWPAMYLPAAAALLAVWLRPRPGLLMATALANLLLLSLYTFHAATAALPLGDGQNRVLRETHGYRQLATLVADLPGPVFADRYQLAAMLNFYQQQHRVSQWPGITRPSEYSRGVIAPLPNLDLLRSSGFWLVSSRAASTDLRGFSPATSQRLADCAGAPLQDISPPSVAPPASGLPCARPLHLWRITHYRATRR